jgi:hypothetical protein
MKHLEATKKQIQTTLVDWVMFKVPELFITIYGK